MDNIHDKVTGNGSYKLTFDPVCQQWEIGQTGVPGPFAIVKRRETQSMQETEANARAMANAGSMVNAMAAIANMQVKEYSDHREILALCKSIAAIELQKCENVAGLSNESSKQKVGAAKKQYVKRDLAFGHLGNGISVYDRLHEEHGDYQHVAHISAEREVTYYVQLSPEDTAKIEKEARESDPSVSFTQQDQKVFKNRPIEEEATGPTPEDDAALERYEAWQEQIQYEYQQGGNEPGVWATQQDKDEDLMIIKINEVVQDTWEREKAMKLEDLQWQLDFLTYHEKGLREFFANHDISEEEIDCLMGDAGRDFLDEWVKTGLVVSEGYDQKDNLYSVGQVSEIEVPLKGIVKTPVSDNAREYINKNSNLYIAENERNYGNATSDQIFICVDANKVKDFLQHNPIEKNEFSCNAPGM